MDDKPFQILPAYHDVLVYDEGDGRRLELSCPSMSSPPRVTVRMGDDWIRDVPSWAADRREVIVDRLRAAGCVVYETGSWLTTVTSPDGSWRIESSEEPDERAPAWERTKITAVATGEAVVDLPMVRLVGDVRFSTPGLIELSLRQRYEGQWVVEVDPANKRFRELPNGLFSPLDQLADLTVPNFRKAAPPSPRPTQPPARIRQWLWMVLSLMFVAAAVFIVCTSPSVKDRCLAGLTGLFFGACGVIVWMPGSKRRR